MGSTTGEARVATDERRARNRGRRVRAIALVLVLVAAGGCSDDSSDAGAAGNDGTTRQPQAADGEGPAVGVRAPAVPVSVPDPALALVAEETLSPRLSELTLTTPALAGETHVRVLVPASYATSDQSYPVLYLFHGGTEDWTAWTDPGQKGDAEGATEGLDLIVVMPDIGPFGYSTDFYNEGAFGAPMWETYLTAQLLPFVDSHYRTIPDRSARATAGLSLGGHGAVSLAARHPDLYGITASFSGAVDNNNAFSQDLVSPVAGLIYGTYEAEEVRWRGGNSWDLAANLANTDLTLFVGTDEEFITEMAHSFRARLTELGIEHGWNEVAGGTHTYEFFQQYLVEWLPHLMDFFATDHDLPASFTYVSIKPEYTVYDWTVHIERPALEFSALQVTGADRFTLTGSGTADVVTGALYEAGETYTVTSTGPDGAAEERSVVADGEGRLVLDFDLGPVNEFQQFTDDAEDGAPADDPGNLPFFVRGDESRFFVTEVSVHG